MAASQKHIQKTAKFLTYVLGRHPDEFGLVLDENGFVKVRELLKALAEEPEWRYLRSGHLNEASVSVQPAVIQIRDGLIRAVERSRIPCVTEDFTLPKILYTAVRQRAYPVVSEKGLRPGATSHVVMATEKEMARRLGKRIDNKPVVLKVHIDKARAAHVRIRKYGTHLYLADDIPAGVFSGPPLPKEKEKPVKPKPVDPEPETPKTPGSYFPDLAYMGNLQPDKERRRRRRDQNRKKKHRGSGKA